jgi:hypothetical protein
MIRAQAQRVPIDHNQDDLQQQTDDQSSLRALNGQLFLPRPFIS